MSDMGDQAEDDEKNYEAENDVFAMARENHEMDMGEPEPAKGKPGQFANHEMVDKIEKMENDMMDEKKWQMKGEV